MANFGLLAAKIVSLFWGTPANFNGFRVLTALLHGTLLVGVSQTLRHWTEGATYIHQGGHHVGIGPHSSFLFCFIQYLSRDCLGRASLKWSILCLVGCKTLTESINSVVDASNNRCCFPIIIDSWRPWILPVWQCLQGVALEFQLTGSPLVIEVEDTEDSKPKDGRRWSL